MIAFSAVVIAFSVALLHTPSCRAHMLMSYPLPRGYSGNSAYSPKDYDLSSPIGSALMCKGKPVGTPTATFRAGEIVNVKFSGSARHGGVQIQSNYEWPVKLPDTLPSCDRCTFAWTWINAIGNREYYMNCADITIRGPTGPSPNVRGTPLKLANLPGYPTIQPPVNNNGPAGSTVHYYPLQPF